MGVRVEEDKLAELIQKCVEKITDDIFNSSLAGLVRDEISNYGRINRATAEVNWRTYSRRTGMPKHCLALKVFEIVYGVKMPVVPRNFDDPVNEVLSRLGLGLPASVDRQYILNCVADELVRKSRARLIHSLAPTGTYGYSQNGVRRVGYR